MTPNPDSNDNWSEQNPANPYNPQTEYLSLLLQCLELVRQQIGDKILEAREVGNVGAVHLASGDFDKAVECHLEHLQIAVNAGNKVSIGSRLPDGKI